MSLRRGVGFERSEAGELRVCELSTGTVLARHAGDGGGDGAFSPDGNSVLVPGAPDALWEWQRDAWLALPVKVGPNPVLGPGELLAVTAGQREVSVSNARTGEIVRSLSIEAKGNVGTQPLAFAPDGGYLVVGGTFAARGLTLATGDAADLGENVLAAAVGSNGVVALATAGGIEFRKTSDGALLGSLTTPALRRGKSATDARDADALWRNARGEIEVVGSRAPWLASLPCRVGDTSVPAELCFDVLERAGVAREIATGGR